MKSTNASSQSKRDLSYPAFTLEDCLKFSEGVKDMGGSRTPVAKSVLAKHCGLAESTPGFFQKLGAAKCFGIIEGWGSYTLTDYGKQYFYPTSESAKAAAELHFLKKPSAFAILVKRFDGEKLPPASTLGNILHQEAGIADSWKDRVASIFIRSANFIGVVDGNGFLRHDAAMQTMPENPVNPEQQESATETKAQQDGVASKAPQDVVRFPRRPDAPAPGNTAWIFPYRGSYVRLETPEEMPGELWEKLNAYVQILKPFDSES